MNRVMSREFSVLMYYLMLLLMVLLFTSKSSGAKSQSNSSYTFDSTSFAFSKFYEAAIKYEGGNFVMSPFAAWTTLSLAFNGVHKTLQRQFFLLLFSNITTIGDSPTDGTSFWEWLKNYFYEKFYPTVESKELLKPEETCLAINNWIDQQINLRISNSIIRDGIESTSGLILVTTVNKWTIMIPRYSKTYRRFYYPNKTVASVPTLEVRGLYKCNDIEGILAHIIELPLKIENGTQNLISMFLIIPKRGSNFTKIENQLRSIEVPALFKGKLMNLLLYLPEFRLETKIDIKSILNDLGMTDSFINSQNFFDFKNLSMKVNQIFQQVSIKVTENTSEFRTLSGIHPPHNISVLVDRPFLFIICTESLVLFSARVFDPINKSGLRESSYPLNPVSTKITHAIDHLSNEYFIASNNLTVVEAVRPEIKNVNPVSNVENPDNVCLTPSCVYDASQLLKNMDTSVEPCENFYQFACGGFVDLTPIPDYQSAVSTMSIANDKLEGHLKTILQKEIQLGDLNAFRMAKKLYKNCMEEDKIEKQGLEPLFKMLRKFHGWPVLLKDTWNEREFDWIESTFQLHSAGYTDDFFMKISVDVDRNNTNQRIIYLSPPTSKRLYGKNLFSKNERPSYKDYMFAVAEILGVNDRTGKNEIIECYNFGLILEKLSQEYRGVSINLKYNPMTIFELSQTFPSIPWKEYFTKLFPSNIEINDNELIIVESPSYIRDLIGLISKTEKRVHSNYMIWNTIASSVKYLNKNIRKKYLIYVSETTGQTEMKPRWKECINVVRKKMPLSLGALYIRNYFKQNSKKNVDNMVKDMREFFISSVDKFNWMDDNKKNITRDRLKAMFVSIAYPKELLNDLKFDEVYEGLELSNDNYFQNILELKLFERQYSFGKLREPVNNDSMWINYGNAAEIYPYYSLIDNSIQLPAGILQDDFFNVNRPMYMNYGAIGFIIGHEILHAIYSTSEISHYYLHDRGFSPSWSEYLQEVQCISKQYDQYFDENSKQNLNGKQTQEENIADSGGIKGAYLVYKKWSSKYGKLEPKLPGLPYTPNQMFWISVANVLCTKERKISLIHTIKTNTHSPEEFRIRGSLSNILEFANDFKCQVNSTMNPAKKCNFI